MGLGYHSQENGSIGMTFKQNTEQSGESRGGGWRAALLSIRIEALEHHARGRREKGSRKKQKP